MSNKNQALSSSVSRRRNKQSRGTWTMSEDESLTKAVEIHGAKNWKKIAESVPGRSDVQCLHRWQKVLNPDLVKGPWTEEEDNKVRDLVKIHGPKKWSVIASHLPGRIGKQCRERWTNHLDPAIKKGNWEPWEDDLIISLQRDLGNKWARIAKHLPGRTDNAVKNRFNSTISRRIRQQRPSGSGKKRNSQKSKLSPSNLKAGSSSDSRRDDEGNSDDDDDLPGEDESSQDAEETGVDEMEEKDEDIGGYDDPEGLDEESSGGNKTRKNSAFSMTDNYDSSLLPSPTRLLMSKSTSWSFDGSPPATPNEKTYESFSYSEAPFPSTPSIPFSPLSRSSSSISAFTSTKRSSPPSILKKRKRTSNDSPNVSKRSRHSSLSTPSRLSSPELSPSLSPPSFQSPILSTPPALSPQFESPQKELSRLSSVRRQLLSDLNSQDTDINLTETPKKETKCEVAPSQPCALQESVATGALECSSTLKKDAVDKGLMTLHMLQQTVHKTTPLLERVNSILSPKIQRKITNIAPENCTPTLFEDLTKMVNGIES